MSKRITSVAIFVFFITISLASAQKENIQIILDINLNLTDEYLAEYGETIKVPSDIVIDSYTFLKNSQKRTNFVYANETNASLENNEYFLKIESFKNNYKINTGYVPIFNFEEDYKEGEKTILFVGPYVGQDLIQIVYKNQLKARIRIDTKTCNSNNTCESSEDYFSCPNDCHVSNADDVCVLDWADRICDPDCSDDDRDCTDAQLCNNKQIDPLEEFIDCGSVCNTQCIFNDTSLNLLVKRHDQGKFDLAKTVSYLGGKFGYELFLN